MKIYIVQEKWCKDGESGDTVKVFLDKAKAIEFASNSLVSLEKDYEVQDYQDSEDFSYEKNIQDTHWYIEFYEMGWYNNNSFCLQLVETIVEGE